MNSLILDTIKLLLIVVCFIILLDFLKPKLTNRKVAIKIFVIGILSGVIMFILGFLIKTIVSFLAPIGINTSDFDTVRAHYLRLSVVSNVCAGFIYGYCQYIYLKRQKEIRGRDERKYSPLFFGIGCRFGVSLIEMIIYPLIFMILNIQYTYTEISGIDILFNLLSLVTGLLCSIGTSYIAFYAIIEIKGLKPSLLLVIGFRMLRDFITGMINLWKLTGPEEAFTFLYILNFIISLVFSAGIFFFAWKFWIPNREKFIEQNKEELVNSAILDELSKEEHERYDQYDQYDQHHQYDQYDQYDQYERYKKYRENGI